MFLGWKEVLAEHPLEASLSPMMSMRYEDRTTFLLHRLAANNMYGYVRTIVRVECTVQTITVPSVRRQGRHKVPGQEIRE